MLADPAYPGWKVTVDGHAAKSLVSRGIFRAVDLPAGAHRVVWTFEPPRLRIGALISVAALLVLLGVAALPWIRRRRGGAYSSSGLNAPANWRAVRWVRPWPATAKRTAASSVPSGTVPRRSRTSRRQIAR